MKSSLLFTCLLCASTLLAQSTGTSGSAPQTHPSSSSPQSSSPSTSSPATSSALRARGPEAVAAQDPSRVVATIDGKPVTAREAANMLKAIPPEQLRRYQAQLPTVVQQIYRSQALAQQALKLNLDQQSPVKEQLELNRDGILAQAYINKVANSAATGPTPDPAQYYNSHPDEFDRVKLLGIFVAFNPPGTPATGSATNRTEEQARTKADDLEKKVKAGGDFTTLARTESDNQTTAARGGEIGTFSVTDPQIPADLKSAIQKLQPGQVSEPIRIPNAFLIVKEESHNKMTLDQAKPEIVQKLQKERSDQAVKQEVDKYKIDVKDPDFFNASASSIPSLQRPQASTAAPAGRTPGAEP